jgi:hypothetical protein
VIPNSLRHVQRRVAARTLHRDLEGRQVLVHLVFEGPAGVQKLPLSRVASVEHREGRLVPQQSIGGVHGWVAGDQLVGLSAIGVQFLGAR